MVMYLNNKLFNMLAWQVVNSINILEDGFTQDGDPTNCCPICCGPCYELLKILNNRNDREDLEAILAECEYVSDGGWRFWNDKKQRFRVKKIKKLWFGKDGGHKQICMSSDGVDQSDQIHRAIREDVIAKRLKKLGVMR